MSFDFPGKGTVSVVKTRPETILDDIGELMTVANYRSALPGDLATILKTSISRQTWYPAASSNPWQIEGIIRQLQNDKYQRLVAAQNDTVGVDVYTAERNTKHKYVVDKYGVENVHLYEPHVEWITYEPKAEMLVLHDIFPEGIQIPRMFIGKNMIHLPTVRTHGLSIIAGAMHNALGGMLNHRRHLTDSVLHQALVDVLAIQREIHPGIFAVMDGTLVGGGPDSGAYHPIEKDIFLASADQVAIDSISARLQGFDPMQIDFIRYAHEQGLGIGDPDQIEIVGYDISLEVGWNVPSEDTSVESAQNPIKCSPLESLESMEMSQCRSQFATCSRAASNLYQNIYWFPFVGRKRVKQALTTGWGRMFKSYDDGKAVLPSPEPKATLILVTIAAGFAAVFVMLLAKVFGRKQA